MPVTVPTRQTGPTIQVVAYIPQYGDGSQRGQLPTTYLNPEAEKAAARFGMNIKYSGPLAIQGIFSTGNREPPAQLTTGYAAFVNSKDYRNIHEVRASFDFGVHSDASTAIRGTQVMGYTPQPSGDIGIGKLLIGHMKGEGNLREATVMRVLPHDGTAGYVERVSLSLYRLGGVGRAVNTILTGYGTPYAWTEVTYRLYDDGHVDIEVSGSKIPSQAIYVDGNLVSQVDMVHDRNNQFGNHKLADLAEFIQSGGRPGAARLAPGGTLVRLSTRSDGR
jgi:hypothetical protein